MKRLILGIFLISQIFLTSCGTLSKPLIHQTSKQLDYSIVFLDSLGLVLFIVPGVAFFTIDYVTGTLFLTPNFKDPTERLGPDPQKVRDLLKQDSSIQAKLGDKKIEEIVNIIAKL